jgi:hypothetical protein
LKSHPDDLLQLLFWVLCNILFYFYILGLWGFMNSWYVIISPQSLYQ